MSRRFSIYILMSTLLAVASACSGRQSAGSGGDERWDALQDTLVCVVDRTSPTGLRTLPGKVDTDGSLLVLSGGRSVPLSQVHPVSLMAGYAGAEAWSRSGGPVTHGGRRFVRTGGERRVPENLLARVGDHQGVPLFAAVGENPPEAVYIPLRPGCVFQAYIREDLL